MIVGGMEVPVMKGNREVPQKRPPVHFLFLFSVPVKRSV